MPDAAIEIVEGEVILPQQTEAHRAAAIICGCDLILTVFVGDEYRALHSLVTEVVDEAIKAALAQDRATREKSR